MRSRLVPVEGLRGSAACLGDAGLPVAGGRSNYPRVLYSIDSSADASSELYCTSFQEVCNCGAPLEVRS